MRRNKFVNMKIFIKHLKKLKEYKFNIDKIVAR